MMVSVHKTILSTHYTFCKCEGVLDVDVGAINIFCNQSNTLTQLMNKEVPWRDGWEKASKSLQVFIEA